MGKKILKFDFRPPRKAKRRRELRLLLSVFALTFIGGSVAVYVNRAHDMGSAAPIAAKSLLSAPAVQTNEAGTMLPQRDGGLIVKRFELCDGPVRDNCVVDGDTFWLDGEKIRIADIDTPEVSEPQCPAELNLGMRATGRLVELLNQGPFELRAWSERDQDGFGRKLRVVVRHGHSLGDQLVAEGLAHTWAGQKEPWC